MLLCRTGRTLSRSQLEELFRIVYDDCSFYPECGSLSLSQWIRIGIQLHSEPRAPPEVLLTWQLCKEVVEELDREGPLSRDRELFQPQPLLLKELPLLQKKLYPTILPPIAPSYETPIGQLASLDAVCPLSQGQNAQVKEKVSLLTAFSIPSLHTHVLLPPLPESSQDILLSDRQSISSVSKLSVQSALPQLQPELKIGEVSYLNSAQVEMSRAKTGEDFPREDVAFFATVRSVNPGQNVFNCKAWPYSELLLAQKQDLQTSVTPVQFRIWESAGESQAPVKQLTGENEFVEMQAQLQAFWVQRAPFSIPIIGIQSSLSSKQEFSEPYLDLVCPATFFGIVLKWLMET